MGRAARRKIGCFTLNADSQSSDIKNGTVRDMCPGTGARGSSKDSFSHRSIICVAIFILFAVLDLFVDIHIAKICPLPEPRRDIDESDLTDKLRQVAELQQEML